MVNSSTVEIPSSFFLHQNLKKELKQRAQLTDNSLRLIQIECWALPGEGGMEDTCWMRPPRAPSLLLSLSSAPSLLLVSNRMILFVEPIDMCSFVPANNSMVVFSLLVPQQHSTLQKGQHFSFFPPPPPPFLSLFLSLGLFLQFAGRFIYHFISLSVNYILIIRHRDGIEASLA